MGYLDRQTVSSTVLPKKKPVTAQEHIDDYQANAGKGNRENGGGLGMMARGVDLKKTIVGSSDSDLATYAGSKFFGFRGIASREITRRQGVATEQAAKDQAAATTAARNEQQQAMLNLQRESQNLAANGGADLGADSTAANVVAGGTADAEGANDATNKKKKGAGTGMAMQLGINV